MSITRTGKEAARRLIGRTGLSRMHLQIRKAMGQNVGHLLYPSLAERFSAVYGNRVWLNGRPDGSLSGFGSELENTASVREALPHLLRTIGSRVLLDLGCGDFNWMKEVQIPCGYIGVDIVPGVVEGNAARYGSPERTFRTLDATFDPLPSSDTVLCREVLFHLSFRDIRRVIENVRRSGALYLMATSDSGLALNADILSGDFRLLNLQKPPFSFPPPPFSICDNALSADRVLAVWKVAAIPG